LNQYTILFSFLWALAAAGVAWYCAVIAQQITYVTLADGRRQERSLPLVFRLLLPLAPNFMPLFEKPVFNTTRARIEKKITAAGFEGLIRSEDILALRILLPLVIGIFIWIPFIKFAVSAGNISFLEKTSVFLYMLGPVLLCAYPTVWLKKALGNRHKSIRRAIPFVLDLLTLSVEAGMDFMTALQGNIERRKLDPFGEELIRVIREIQLGKTRREALRDMSHRVDLSELRSVVNALAQADELGVSIGSILRIQADQMRQRRFEHAEKLANESPVKLLGPLLFFIFPAVFLILLGPIITRLIQQGL